MGLYNMLVLFKSVGLPWWMALKYRSEGKFSQWTKVRIYIDSSADGLVGWSKFRRIMIEKLVTEIFREKVCIWHLWLAKKWRYLYSVYRPLRGWPKKRKILMIKYIKIYWPVGQFCNSSYFPQSPLSFSRAPEQGGPDSREVGYSWAQQHGLEFTNVNQPESIKEQWQDLIWNQPLA